MIEAIERATLDAMPPQRLERWGDWLLPFDNGTVGRSHSAVPLRHGMLVHLAGVLHPLFVLSVPPRFLAVEFLAFEFGFQ